MTIYEIAALLIVAAMVVLLHWDVFASWRYKPKPVDDLDYQWRVVTPPFRSVADLFIGEDFIYYRTHDGEESQWPIRADKLDWPYVSHFRFARPEEVSRMAAVNALEKMERANPGKTALWMGYTKEELER